MFGSIFNQKKKDDETGANPAGPQPQDPQAAAPVQTPMDTPAPASAPATPAANPITLTPPSADGTAATPAASNPAVAADMSALGHLDPRATQVLTRAQEEAKRIKQQGIDPDQILIGLLADEQIFKLLNESKVDGGQLSQEIQSKEKMGVYHGQPTLSSVSQQLFDQAYKDSKLRGSNFVSPEDLLISAFNPIFSTAAYLTSHNLKKETLVESFSKNPNLDYGKKTILEKYGVDLTEEARAGKLDPVAGREKEVDRIVHVLLRRTKNNPIIIGEPGVGKTAIIEGLSQLIVTGKVPKDLQGKRIFQLDVASLVAGASHRGEFEERLRAVIQEVLAANNQIILFIDEIHALMGTGEGEGMNAANIIKPHLARGHFQIIGATTTTEYRKNFEKDKAFERRFQPVIAEEPSEENAFEMLKVLREKYEKFHRVTLSDDTLKECVKLSKKYVGERYLPDKAIDLLDEAASHVKLQNDSGKRTDTVVKKSDIESVVSAWTGIPITKLTEDESEKLLKLEDRIHKRMIGQEEAVVAVSEAVRRGRIGLASGQRPIASFIFLGPTGTGKTELAKTLAELLFGRDDAMVRLDMSEYMEKHEVAKIIGAPPGYVGYEEGGVLTEAVRKKPYCIVLMDEIEKAHPDVFNILLQLLEDGRLTDNKGNTISFKNTIVICTSNIGSQLIQQKLSMQDGAKMNAEQLTKQFKDLQKLIREELTKFLRPEVLNRFDEVVIFEPLRPEHMAGIVRLGIAKTAKLLKEQGFGLQITEKAVAKLSKDGYDPVYGARPLRRLIQTVIENPIALAIISKKFSIGDVIVIDYSDSANEFVFTKGGAAADVAPLSAENFRNMLAKLAKPETIIDPAEVSQYTQLHDKLALASSNNDKNATTILNVNASTNVSDIESLRKALEEARGKGDSLATDILTLATSVAQQIESANRMKKVFLQIIDPSSAPTDKKDQFTALHDKLSEGSKNGNALAASFMAISSASPADVVSKLIGDLAKAKNDEDELANEILKLVNDQIAADVDLANSSNPVMQYKGVLKQILNPLYSADPVNKAKFSQLYDKMAAASKQNNTVASSILALTDLTSDADISNIKKQLEQASGQGDGLAKEIIQTIEAEIKRSKEAKPAEQKPEEKNSETQPAQPTEPAKTEASSAPVPTEPTTPAPEVQPVNEVPAPPAVPTQPASPAAPVTDTPPAISDQPSTPPPASGGVAMEMPVAPSVQEAVVQVPVEPVIAPPQEAASASAEASLPSVNSGAAGLQPPTRNTNFGAGMAALNEYLSGANLITGTPNEREETRG